MNAIVLAAGFSTRLYPITKYFPKGLLPIFGQAIVDYVLKDLMQIAEVKQIALVTNHLYFPLFASWIKTFYADKNIQLFDNGVVEVEKRLGSIGDLQFVLKETKWQEDLVVVASDTLTSLKIADFIAFYQNHPGFVNTIFDTHDPAIITKKLGCAEVDGDKLVAFTEKPEIPKTTLTSIPYYIYPKIVLPLVQEYIAGGNPVDAPGSIIPWLIGKVPTYGYTVQNGYYHDVGTIEVYNRLAETFRR